MSNISPWFVMTIGMATVFIGLIALVLLTGLMSKLCCLGKGKGA